MRSSWAASWKRCRHALARPGGQGDPADKGIWEIRSYSNKPFLRVFGWFVLPKWFVAAQYRFRADLEPTNGNKWNAAIQQTQTIRDEMFAGESLFSGASYNEFLRNPR
jgi:hypothetical protein